MKISTKVSMLALVFFIPLASFANSADVTAKNKATISMEDNQQDDATMPTDEGAPQQLKLDDEGASNSHRGGHGGHRGHHGRGWGGYWGRGYYGYGWGYPYYGYSYAYPYMYYPWYY